jgi:hypothetical protein
MSRSDVYERFLHCLGLPDTPWDGRTRIPPLTATGIVSTVRCIDKDPDAIVHGHHLARRGIGGVERCTVKSYPARPRVERFIGGVSDRRVRSLLDRCRSVRGHLDGPDIRRGRHVDAIPSRHPTGIIG